MGVGGGRASRSASLISLTARLGSCFDLATTRLRGCTVHDGNVSKKKRSSELTFSHSTHRSSRSMSILSFKTMFGLHDIDRDGQVLHPCSSRSLASMTPPGTATVPGFDINRIDTAWLEIAVTCKIALTADQNQPDRSVADSIQNET